MRFTILRSIWKNQPTETSHQFNTPTMTKRYVSIWNPQSRENTLAIEEIVKRYGITTLGILLIYQKTKSRQIKTARILAVFYIYKIDTFPSLLQVFWANIDSSHRYNRRESGSSIHMRSYQPDIRRYPGKHIRARGAPQHRESLR